MRKLIFCIILASVLFASILSSQEKKTCGITYKASDASIKNIVVEYNEIIETVLRKILVLTGKYDPVIDYADRSDDELNALNLIKRDVLVGIYDREESKKVRNMEFANKDNILFYNVHYDFDENDNKVYYLNLSLFDAVNNKDIKPEKFEINKSDFENNVTRAVWNSGLKFFDLPQIGYTNISDSVIKDYNDKNQWGTIKIKTSPGNSNIYVDEGYVGTTVEGEYLILNSYKGDARISIEKYGYYDVRQTVTISPKKETVLDFSLERKTGILNIETSPKIKGAIIKLGDKEIGVTNSGGKISLLNFPVGVHSLEIYADKYKTQKIDVEVLEKTFSQKTIVKVDMTFQDISLEVDCNVKNVEIYLDGILMGKRAPLVLNNVSQGEHKIKVFNDDYGKSEIDVKISKPDNRKVLLILKEKGGLPPYPYTAFKFWIGQLWVDDGPVISNMNYILDDNITRQIALVGNSFSVSYMFSFLRFDTTFLFFHGSNNWSNGAGATAPGHNYISFDLLFSSYFNFSVRKYIMDPLGFKTFYSSYENGKNAFALLSDFILDVGISYNVNLYRGITDSVNSKIYNLSNYFHYTNFYFSMDFLTVIKIVKNPFFDKLIIGFPLHINIASQYGNPNVIWGVKLGVAF
ncbi:MAG TPA: PEGA domain-containing protein [Spirochaetota bacterium]|jgi:hypothetical protein|nr:PEGA domain-containing protein [Spirochaetota bacterium]